LRVLSVNHENVLELTTKPAEIRGMSGQELRIIDANLNRVAEGLRVLEDIARLALDDVSLSQQLKNMRHNLTKVDWPSRQQLLASRDAEGDVGVNLEVDGEGGKRDLSTIVTANARRVQEALRVMEELAKTSGLKLDPEKFKKARFGLYTIEKNMIARLLVQDKEIK
jgi:thiamine-phosphate pyrophosphorylase